MACSLHAFTYSSTSSLDPQAPLPCTERVGWAGDEDIYMVRGTFTSPIHVDKSPVGSWKVPWGYIMAVCSPEKVKTSLNEAK